MVLKLNNSLFTTNRTVLKEFKTAGGKKAVLLFREKIDHCDLMRYTQFQLAKIVESREE